MDLKLLNSELVDTNFLRKIIYFEEIYSTNAYAKANEISDDCIILTANQRCGFGRFSRKWESAPGKDLTFTIVKSFSVQVDEIHLVNFYTSYILHSTLVDFFKNDNSLFFTLKWPNDILLNAKKIGGILLEVQNLDHVLKKFIIGIGLNVNSETMSSELLYKASSLLVESGSETLIEDLLISIMKNFYRNIDLIKNRELLMKKWKEGFDMQGKRIRFRLYDDDRDELEAVAENIDSDGGLVLKFDDGRRRKFYSGEVRIGY